MKFEEYMVLRNSKIDDCEYNIHDIANELDLDLTDRVKYLRLLTSDKRQQFINERLDFRKHVLDWEVRSKDSYYLN